jgi:hypothetical protein
MYTHEHVFLNEMENNIRIKTTLIAVTTLIMRPTLITEINILKIFILKTHALDGSRSENNDI